MTHAGWPALPYEEWRETLETLHRYTQVAGKLRLALSPFEPGWANVPLYVTPRGLTSSPIPVGSRAVDVEFDLVDHVVVMRSSDGMVERRRLGGSVAEFYADFVRMLERLRVDVELSVVPSEVPDPIPFPDDHVHHVYEAPHAARFQQVLVIVDAVLKAHRARFLGRTTPVHFFWGSFDLAVTRYSGRQIPPPSDGGVIARYGADGEEICAGWWPGDQRIPYPAFYAYAYPPLAGLESKSIQPAGAAWNAAAGEFLFPYETARADVDPRRAVLDFCASTYAAAAALGGWSDDLTHVNAPPYAGHRVVHRERINR